MVALARRWLGIPAEALVWHEWEGELVVRNERTGSTHLLAPLAGKVLTILVQTGHPLEAADIAEKVDSGLVEHEARPDTAAIEHVLGEFHRLGLAEMTER